MRKCLICIQAVFVILLLVPGFSGAFEAEVYSTTIDVFRASPQVRPYFENAYGYAVFPTVGKGGLGVGGGFGKGRVYIGKKITGLTTLTEFSVGFQGGGQAFSQVIFFQDRRAYEEFTSGEFAFDAQMTAVVITAGAQAQAGSSGASASVTAGPRTGIQSQTKYYRGMAVFVRAKGGLMFEAAVGGQVFTFDPL